MRMLTHAQRLAQTYIYMIGYYTCLISLLLFTLFSRHDIYYYLLLLLLMIDYFPLFSLSGAIFIMRLRRDELF